MRRGLLTFALASVAALSAGAAHALIINVDGTTSTGTTLSVGAGDYTLSYATSGGLYDGVNPWSDVSGCNASGKNCTHGWVEYFSLSEDGHVYEYAGPAHPFATAAEALATTIASPFFFNVDGGSFSSIAYPVPLDLSATTSLTFFFPDSVYTDNEGGISLLLSPVVAAVPEPSDPALIVAGLAGLGLYRRRQRNRSVQ